MPRPSAAGTYPFLFHMTNLKSLLRVLIFALGAICIAAAAMAAFAAGPFLTLDTFSGKPGETLNVSGGGFAPNSPIQIFLGAASSPARTVTTDAIGLFTDAFVTIPVNAPAGPLSVAGRAADGTAAMNSYFVQPFTPAITLAADQNTPGSLVRLSGTGFAPGEAVAIALAGASAETAADPLGNFAAASLAIPDAVAGTYTVTATGRASGAQAVGFFFIGEFFPGVTPSAYFLLPDETLTFTGSGFAPGEAVTVRDSSGTVFASFAAGADGGFEGAGAVKIPFSWAGRQIPFQIAGARSRSPASLLVTIGQFLPFASPSNYFLLPGDALSFSGGGFAPGETVNVTEGPGNAMGSFAADASGMFLDAGTVTIPFDFLGSVRTFHLAGARSGAGADITLTVGQFFSQILPSSFFTKPGTDITVSGFGFSPGEQVLVSLEQGASHTVAADAEGNISAGPFRVPFTNLHSLALDGRGLSSQTVSASAITVGQFFPSVAPSTYYALPGAVLSFSAAGFAPGETVNAQAGGNPQSIATATADASGAIEIPAVTLPFGTPAGPRAYSFTGQESGASANVSVTVASFGPWMISDNYFPLPGSTIHLSGFGFAPGEHVSLLLGSDTVGGGMSSTSGNTDSVPAAIPFGLPGPARFELRGDMSGASAALDLGLGSLMPGATADSYYALPGTTVHVTARGFAPGETVRASLGGFSAKLPADQTGGAGPFSIPLPFGIPSPAAITLNGMSSGAATALNVTLASFFPSVTPSAYYALPGSAISFSGAGFAANESVALLLNGANVGSAASDGTGRLAGIETALPNAPAGTLHFAVSGTMSQTTVPVDITLAALQPGVILDTYYALGGSPLSVTAMGFAARENVEFRFEGALLGTAVSDADGTAALLTEVPFGPPGAKEITATGQNSGARAASPFTQARFWNAALALANYAAAPGGAITFIGSGFASGEPISIRTDRTGPQVLGTFTAGADGSFGDSGFSLPASFAPGLLTLTITGEHSFETRDIVIYVTGG